MSSDEAVTEGVVLTTPLLMHDLKEIEHLIAALLKCRNTEAGDVDDLNWLRSRRRYILALLASRRAQRRRKIVRLDMWRNGGVGMQEIMAHVA